ncbi:hypothetical protein SISNIDRAFT_453810 [Sistotremastrum niveocremeum HHB9708]|uniref:F-box domain-containing protein n=2 Tax=Sistotremastraceae TaxID=3402574 RepID=A0A164VEX7_9AGAM|nr:hypothetical protein SISNIDRAFT_453810 [Sistotremastrum niveocremeum HHB9708]KZT33475.1 hypothetical protein SISSUDRAFT_1054181 [Sistotremastrum suecicum HHB10207 ss-3]
MSKQPPWDNPARRRSEPSTEDFLLADAEISKHTHAIRKAESRIRELQQLIGEAQREVQHHEHAIESVRSYLTLARRLPEELYTKIFEFCVAADPRPLLPLKLAHVCASWRHAALNSPTLWTRIRVDASKNRRPEYIRHFATHARQMPLYISLTVWRDETAVDDITAALLPYWSQCKSFALDVLSFNCFRCLINTFNLPAPLLNDVDLHVGSAVTTIDEGDDIPRIFDLPVLLPNCGNISLIKLSVPAMITPECIPETLRGLHITLDQPDGIPFSASAVLAILEERQNLRAFSMHTDARVTSLPNDATVNAENLEYLDLEMDPTLFAFLENLIAPKLSHLHLHNRVQLAFGHAETPTSRVLRSLIERSNVAMRSLFIHDCDLNQPTARFICENSPFLETLYLHDTDVDDAFLWDLAKRDGSGRLTMCPSLKKLELRWASRVSGRALVDFVRARNGPVYPPFADEEKIEEIVVISCPFVGDQDVIDIASMTKCRLSSRPGDACRKSDGCCANAQYKMRFRFNHAEALRNRRYPGLLL